MEAKLGGLGDPRAQVSEPRDHRLKRLVTPRVRHDTLEDAHLHADIPLNGKVVIGNRVRDHAQLVQQRLGVAWLELQLALGRDASVDHSDSARKAHLEADAGRDFTGIAQPLNSS